MSLYRGAGGASDATDDSTVNAVAGYASSAASSATNAASSATSASTSASSASTSATNAAASATLASTRASNAQTSATQAAGYATDASNEADDAAASALIAYNAANDSSTYSSNALNYKNSASSYATAAASSAASAASSATAAAASVSDAQTLYGDATALSDAVTAAAGSATSAASSASTATTKAGEASDSAIDAAASAVSANSFATASQVAANASQAYSSAAQAARDATLAAYDTFDDRYLGVKSADPTEDNDGNALVAGSLYFNESTGSMKVYTGTAWVDAYVSGSGFLVVNNNLSDLQSASTARTNLGLGTAATTATTDYATAAQGTKADTAIQAADLGTAAYTATTDYATAAQGTKADSAVQPNTSPTFTGATFSGGTAYGVAYLNGSKVLTTGTNLTYGTGGGAYGLVAVAGGVSTIDLKSGGGNATQRFISSSGTSWHEIVGTSAGWSFTNKNQTGTISFITTATGGATTQNLLMDSNGITQGATAFTANPTLGAGTVNGVAYLNGSKVLTSGSALTFDGSSLVGTGKFQSQVLRVKDASYSELYFSTADTGGNGAISYNHSANAMAFYANGSEQMRLTSTGLGIGTSSPAYKLDIGNATANSTQMAGTTAGIYIYGIGRNGVNGAELDSYDAITFRTGSTSGARTGSEKMRLDQSGNLGLGVTPSAWGNGGNIQLNGANIFGNSGLTYGANAYYNAGWKYITSGVGAQYCNQYNGQHQWYTAPSGTAGTAISFTQAMTLDASGNLGVGTTSPAVRLHVANSGDNVSYFERVGGSRVVLYNASGDSYFGTTTNTPLRFATNDVERARIDSSGNLLVGTTSQIGAGQVCIYHDNLHWGMAIKNPGSSTQYTAIQFYYGSTSCGLIQANNNNTTSYLTSSDYRLKENVRPLSGALNKVAAMRPVTYAWKATGTESDGFIAHELQAVCPDAVSGTKDAVDANGNPVYQGIDTSFLVATLTAAIQELKAEVDSLKSEINTLKGI